MRSGEVLRLIGTYKTLGFACRPSELLDIDDKYTAYCFDEACAYIISRLKAGEKPQAQIAEAKTYSRPSDFYRQFEQ